MIKSELVSFTIPTQDEFRPPCSVIFLFPWEEFKTTVVKLGEPKSHHRVFEHHSDFLIARDHAQVPRRYWNAHFVGEAKLHFSCRTHNTLITVANNGRKDILEHVPYVVIASSSLKTFINTGKRVKFDSPWYREPVIVEKQIAYFA
jgi:hypothetical protein